MGLHQSTNRGIQIEESGHNESAISGLGDLQKDWHCRKKLLAKLSEMDNSVHNLDVSYPGLIPT